jgi:hypothetical protein
MSYGEQLRSIADEYFREHGDLATAREIAIWATTTKRWSPQPGTLVDQCAEELSRAMREDFYTDPQGREVRAKHAARMPENGKQITLWGDIRTASPEHMQRAFQQRRRQIFGDCRQLKADVDSFNENRQPEEPIQVIFDFTLDLIEYEAAKASTLSIKSEPQSERSDLAAEESTSRPEPCLP